MQTTPTSRPRQLLGRDAQPNILHDSAIDERAAELKASIDLITRLIRDSLSIPRSGATQAWVIEAQACRRARLEQLRQYRLLAAQQRAQGALAGLAA